MPGAVPTALGLRLAAASTAGGHQQIVLQPVPSQALLLRYKCCLRRGGLAWAPTRARLQAAASGAAHTSNGCPVGCPACTRCRHLPVAGVACHPGLGLLCRGRVPGPLLGWPGSPRAGLVL